MEESAGCDCSIGNVLFSKLAQLSSASHEQHVSKFNSWISDEFIVIYKFLFVLIHYQLYEKSIRIQTVPASVLQSPQAQVAAVRPVWRPGRWFMSPITCKLSNWHLNTFNSRLDINQVKPDGLKQFVGFQGKSSNDRFLMTPINHCFKYRFEFSVFYFCIQEYSGGWLYYLKNPTVNMWSTKTGCNIKYH